MTPAAIAAFIGKLVEALAKLGPLLLAWLAGRDGQKARDAEGKVDDAAKANEARSRVDAMDAGAVHGERVRWNRDQ